MKGLALATVLMASSFCYGYCEYLSADQALERALNFNYQQITSNGESKYSLKLSSPEEANKFNLKWTAPEKGLYLFEQARSGLVLVSGVDTYPALIGYSDMWQNEGEIPPALMDFMLALDLQIASGENANGNPRISRAPVEPLVKAQWNQDAPFNDLTPELDGKHTLTGCMATAMAEILDYWQYPIKGTGEISYIWNGKNLSYDFSEHPFDWDNMLDQYTDESTPAQNKAVAELMLACGMASKMSYSHTFSGSTDFDAAIGLFKYFGYNEGMELKYRDFYDINDWTDILYTELSEGRPVLYCGFSGAGGHAFVCDGFLPEEDGDYYHINWGWGGMANGYFLINLLNPDYIGLGASASGFNIMQSALIGIQPDPNGSSQPGAPNIGCFGYFATDGFNYPKGKNIMFGIAGALMRSGFYNLSLYPLDVTTGISLSSITTGEKTYYEGNIAKTLQPGEGIETYEVSSSQLPEGTFKVHPAFKINGEWMELPEEIGMHTKMIITVTEEEITIETSNDSSGIIVNQFGIDTLVVNTEEPYLVMAEVECVDYYEPVQLTPVLIQGNYIISQAETKTVRLDPGETKTLIWEAFFEPSPEPGLYKFAILTEKSILATQTVDVVVIDSGTVSELGVSNLRINRRLVSPGNPVKIEGTQFNLSYEVSCEKGWFDGTIGARITHDDIVDINDSSFDLFLLQGDKETLSQTFDVSSLSPDLTYAIKIMAVEDEEEKQIGEDILFTAPSASVEKIYGSENASFYTIDGKKINPQDSGKGIIIIKNKEKSGKYIY